MDIATMLRHGQPGSTTLGLPDPAGGPAYPEHHDHERLSLVLP